MEAWRAVWVVMWVARGSVYVSESRMVLDQPPVRLMCLKRVALVAGRMMPWLMQRVMMASMLVRMLVAESAFVEIWASYVGFRLL